MTQSYNIYCDESCHLEHDNQKVMVLGAIWCPKERSKEISEKLRSIKSKHFLSKTFELKWTKVSIAKTEYYLHVIRYFFEDSDLHFRCLVIPDKSRLNHAAFRQDHDTFYYKMYFEMLRIIFEPIASYSIYLDIKDTRSKVKVELLQKVLCYNQYDFDRRIILKIQQIRSHESEILQVADLLLGAVSYVNRGGSENKGKLILIDEIKKKSGYLLNRTTLMRETKFNIFCWNPRNTSENIA